jgi:hypothetical protein
VKDKPTDWDDDDTEPETGRGERIRDAVPIVYVKVFVSLTEEVEQRPRQNGGNPIDEEIDAGQSFLVHLGR